MPPRLEEIELTRLLDRVDRVAAGVGEGHDVCLRAGCAQQVGREVLVWKRMGRSSDNLAAGFRDELGRVALQGLPERVVRRDEIPVQPFFLHQRPRCSRCESVGIVGPLRSIGRAFGTGKF